MLHMVVIFLLFSTWHILCHCAEVKRTGIIAQFRLQGIAPCKYWCKRILLTPASWYLVNTDTAAFRCLYASALGACSFLSSEMKAFYGKRGVDICKDAVSLPGVASPTPGRPG